MVVLLVIYFVEDINKVSEVSENLLYVSLVQSKVMGPSGLAESIDFDSLSFDAEDFDIFLAEFEGRIFEEWGEITELTLSNELKKYFYIKLYNVYSFIKDATAGRKFSIFYDKKTDQIPQLTILAGNNKESSFSFMHDLRQSFYPFLRILFPQESHGDVLLNGFILKIKIRTFLLFLATLLKYLKSNLHFYSYSLGKKPQSKFDNKNVFVVIRNPLQKEYFENRIANNSSMSGINFFYLYGYFDSKTAFNGVSLIRFNLRSFASVVVGFCRFFFANLFCKSSIDLSIQLELWSNFEHQFLNFNIENFIKKNTRRVKSLVSMEMTGRHSYSIQECCRKYSVVLNRFQVASIAELHVYRLSFYGKFWASDESSYNILNTRFPGQISYDNDLVPSLDVSKISIDKTRVLFATQPYGIEDNILIVKTILSVLPTGFRLIVRRHPRDCYDYQSDFPELEYDTFDDIVSIYSSRLVISKTSTILQSCIFLDVPFISVQIDDYSRKVNLTFLRNHAGRVVSSIPNFIENLKSEIFLFHANERVLNIPNLINIKKSFAVL